LNRGLDFLEKYGAKLLQSGPVIRIDRIIFVGVVVLTLSLIAQEEAVTHYQSNRYSGNATITVDNFKFKEHILSFDKPLDWSGFYEVQKPVLVRYEHLKVSGSSIEIRQIPLSSIITNEVLALELYNGQLAGSQSNLWVHSNRWSEDVSISNSFPRIYYLSKVTNQPPTFMNTFFIVQPYLYQVQLEVREKLLRKDREAFDGITRSARIQYSEANTNNGTK
jgi:hypothetical protein